MFRLRHFDAQLTPREDRDSPIVLRLESARDNAAVFRKVSGSQSLDRIEYHLTGPGVLRAEVIFTPESGRRTLAFDMKPVPRQQAGSFERP